MIDASASATNTPTPFPTPASPTTEIYEYLRRSLSASVFGMPREVVPDLQLLLKELYERAISG